MNKQKYQDHFLLNTETVIPYVRDHTDFFPSDLPLQAEEIGDGNINYVFRVFNPQTSQSLIVKQADKLLRSSGRPLDVNRNKIEAAALAIQHQLAEGFVPEIFDYNENMATMIMEDISQYKNLRLELAAGKIFPNLADEITTFMVLTLANTSDLIMDRHAKKQAVQQFINVELCDISEDLVFTEPYYNYKERNIISDGLGHFVQENLYRDSQLHTEVAYLRNQFMNNAQALLHGDLHSGSIFVDSLYCKIIDPEFAFYGPMGYDVGNVIGNLFFPLAKHITTEVIAKRRELQNPALDRKMTLEALQKAALARAAKRDFRAFLETSIVDIYDLFGDKLRSELHKKVKMPLYNAAFQIQYVQAVLEDSVGFAGTEIIRRTVGDAKVAEITGVTDPEQRLMLEKLLIIIGVTLIKNRKNINCGKNLIDEFRKLVELL